MDKNQGRYHSLGSLKNIEGEESPNEDHTDSLDLQKLQEQNRELIKRNRKLSNTVDALRKERELAIERDKIKQERKGFIEFTKKITAFSEDTHSVSSKEELEISVLQQQLASRDKEIEFLHRQVEESEVKDIKSKSSRDEEEQSEDPVGSVQHKSTLNKLIDEQSISSSLRSNNSELQVRVASLESEIEKLHIQNSHNLLLVEQANAAAQAATSLIATSTKQRKKSSIFGIRRSGRKKSGMDSPSPVKVPSGSKNSLSNSQPSLDESLSEHDLSSYLARKCEPTATPYNPFNKSSDAQLLETSIKLALEEKSEVERQLECLRDEIQSQQNRIEELIHENERKERIYVDAVQEIGTTKQALQLATRERDLLMSENEGLCFEKESLRAEKDALRGKEVKAVLKEKQEMEFLRSENKALMSEIRTLIVNSDGLETSLSQLKREKVAKDVRDHETKLKLKKADQQNERLKRELAEIKQLIDKKNTEIEKIKTAAEISASKPPIGSPKIRISRNSESPAREKHSPSTGQQQIQTPDKRHIGLPVLLDDRTIPKNRILHERAQSEDFTSNLSSTRTVGLPMQRTSSGTKVIAIQTTLPTKETPLKVEERSLMSTSLPIGRLGSFQPLSPKTSDVNSLVKMFETGKSKEEDLGNCGDETKSITIQNDKPAADSDTQLTSTDTNTQAILTDSRALSQTPSYSSSRETTPVISDKTKDKTPNRERRSSSSSSGKSQSKKDEASETTHNVKHTERKRSSSSVTTSTPIRKISYPNQGSSTTSTTPPKDMKHSTTSSKDSNNRSSTKSPAKERKNSTSSSTTSKDSSSTKSPAKERKNSSSSVRKLSHGSSEGKYLPKKDELKSKDHRRTTSLVITNDVANASKKMKDSSEKNETEKQSFHSSISTTPHSSSSNEHEPSDTSKEKLNTITESSMSKNSKGTKLTVSKHISRFSVTVGDPNSTDPHKVTSPLSSEKSQTWPTKTMNETKKVEPTTNTLPSSGKSGIVEKKSTSPTQLTPLSISKPKPPPTVNSKAPSTPINSPSSGEQTPLGIVRNLRSSWEKKTQNSPLKPIAKTGSANIPLSTQDQFSSQTPASPNIPITKSGSGPPGVILSSPGITKPSPPPSTNSFQAPLSPTSKFSRTFHSPLVKTGSSPFITTVPTATTSSVTSSTATNTPVVKQNGVAIGHYTKNSVSKRISSFEPSTSEIETEVRHRPATNGTSSPRSIRRPASLYVSSSTNNNADNRQLSSLISILQEKTSSSPPPPVIENKHTVLPLKRFEQCVILE